MYNNRDIIATLSQYIIRPQLHRIFALLCNSRVSDYVAFTEYCNHMRQFRDIHGKLVIITYRILKYYDIRGFWKHNNINNIDNVIHKLYVYRNIINKIIYGLNTMNISIENGDSYISIHTCKDLLQIYIENNIGYIWENRELIETRIFYDNSDILFIKYINENISDIIFNDKIIPI